MRLLTLESPAAVARAGVEVVAQAVGSCPDLVLGLPTGRTAIPLYDELARRHERAELDLSSARGFNLDELLLPPGHPATFASFMERHVWDRTGLDRHRCDLPDGAASPEAECRRYDRDLAAAGGLGLALLGLGADGHVAYIQPGAVRETTHVAELPTSLADELGVSEQWRPLRAITIGMETVRAAARVLVMATGSAKSAAVAALMDGPEDPQWPCSFLRSHPSLDLLVDTAAASSVAGRRTSA